MSSAFLELERVIGYYQSVVYHLQQNRVYPGMFNAENADKLVQDLKVYAEQQGYDLLLEKKDIFFQTEASFIRQPNLKEVLVIMDIPVARSRNIVTLKRFK